MAKKQGGGKLLPLPFTTFGAIAALDLKATVYCSRCYQHRPINPAAEHLRDRCFATTRFRVTCEPSWEINHVPIDEPPWSKVNRSTNDRFRCQGCGKAVAWRIH
jgi:hypothetical protein